MRLRLGRSRKLPAQDPPGAPALQALFFSEDRLVCRIFCLCRTATGWPASASWRQPQAGRRGPRQRPPASGRRRRGPTSCWSLCQGAPRHREAVAQTADAAGPGVLSPGDPEPPTPAQGASVSPRPEPAVLGRRLVAARDSEATVSASRRSGLAWRFSSGGQLGCLGPCCDLRVRALLVGQGSIMYGDVIRMAGALR